MRRDPRFDDLSGEYKPEIFEKTYRFINDIRSSEKEVCEDATSASQFTKSQIVSTQSSRVTWLLSRVESVEYPLSLRLHKLLLRLVSSNTNHSIAALHSLRSVDVGAALAQEGQRVGW